HLEGWLELGQTFQGRIRADKLVLLQNADAVLVPHGNNGAAEIAFLPCRRRFLLGLQGKLVHILPGEAFDGGDQISANALGHESRVKVRGRVQCPGAAVRSHRYPRHGLYAPSHDQVLPAGSHFHGRQVDRLQTGRAKPTQGHPGNALGPIGCQHGSFGNVRALITNGGYTAHDHIIYLSRIQLVALLEFPQQSTKESDWLDFVQGAIFFAPSAGSADGIENECISAHAGSFMFVIFAIPGARWRTTRADAGLPFTIRQPDVRQNGGLCQKYWLKCSVCQGRKGRRPLARERRALKHLLGRGLGRRGRPCRPEAAGCFPKAGKVTTKPAATPAPNGSAKQPAVSAQQAPSHTRKPESRSPPPGLPVWKGRRSSLPPGAPSGIPCVASGLIPVTPIQRQSRPG